MCACTWWDPQQSAETSPWGRNEDPKRYPKQDMDLCGLSSKVESNNSDPDPQTQLEIVDQWSTRIPPPSKRGSRGNAWIVIEHHSKSLCFYLPIHTGNVLLKFGLNVQSQTEVRIWKLKNLIWLPGGHFESDIAENQHASFHTHK